MPFPAATLEAFEPKVELFLSQLHAGNKQPLAAATAGGRYGFEFSGSARLSTPASTSMPWSPVEGACETWRRFQARHLHDDWLRDHHGRAAHQN